MFGQDRASPPDAVGRKSEKIDRLVEQLESDLEELENKDFASGGMSDVGVRFFHRNLN